MFEVRKNRIIRAKTYIESVRDTFKLDISFEEFARLFDINITTFATESSVGRPMIADYLLQKGIIKTKQEAFDSYLSDDSPAFVSIKSF